MGYGYDAICKECGTKFEVNEGPGMVAMPYHCDRCGKEWWWEFRSKIPLDEPYPPTCGCGGTFTSDAPPRCPKCRSTSFEQDPDGMSMIYD
jgi:predicted Zn-ribbon and HTH transcriptional regulator